MHQLTSKAMDVPTSTTAVPTTTVAREIASARKNISDQERQLASAAFSDFKMIRHAEALQNLKKLLELRPHDARVLSNKSLVEYHLSNLSKTDEFVKQVNTAKKQLEFGTVHTGDELDDIDRSFLLYNEAVLNFHLMKRWAAIEILERLFKIIEPLDDTLAMRVSLLLVECYLLTGQVDLAHGMLTYIETSLFAPKATAIDCSPSEDEHARVHKLLTESLKSNVHMFKARVYLERRFLSQCKREMKLAMNSSGNSVEALFLKANLEFLQGNLAKSLKLLSSAPKSQSVAEAGHALPVLFYNNAACAHFAMRKFHLATLHAQRAFEENLTVMKSLPPVNEKYNSNHQSGRSVTLLNVNKRSEILYNLGLSLLHAERPDGAFECFMEAQYMYQCNPRFWMRLAECCIAVCQQLHQETRASADRKSEHIRSVLSSGAQRKLVISPLSEEPGEKSTESQSAAMPAATLEFANLCLQNAALLLPMDVELEAAMEKYNTNLQRKIQQADGNQTKIDELLRDTPQHQISVDAPPGRPIQTVEAYNLRLSVLACQAYVSLGLGGYSKSLDYSQKLMNAKFADGPLRFLGRVYHAESLIRLEKISEAIQELSPEHLSTYNKFNQELLGCKTTNPFPQSLNDAISMTLLNLASAHSLRSDFDKSKQALRQLVTRKIPAELQAQATLVSVYCELKSGNTSMALTLLKRNEVFPSARLSDRLPIGAFQASTFQNEPVSDPNPDMRNSSSQPPVGFPAFPIQAGGSSDGGGNGDGGGGGGNKGFSHSTSFGPPTGFGDGSVSSSFLTDRFKSTDDGRSFTQPSDNDRNAAFPYQNGGGGGGNFSNYGSSMF